MPIFFGKEYEAPYLNSCLCCKKFEGMHRGCPHGRFADGSIYKIFPLDNWWCAAFEQQGAE